MDARSFGNFMTAKLTDVAKSVENNLLDMTYQELVPAHRAAAGRSTVMQIVAAMPAWLEEFYAAGGNSAPQQSNTVIESISSSEGQ